VKIADRHVQHQQRAAALAESARVAAIDQARRGLLARVVCLQELQAVDELFPQVELERAG
jgi:exonuclease III